MDLVDKLSVQSFDLTPQTEGLSMNLYHKNFVDEEAIKCPAKIGLERGGLRYIYNSRGQEQSL